ncbi:MAG: hypothetical protein AAGI52_09215 [Bacteroidota bacterium]
MRSLPLLARLALLAVVALASLASPVLAQTPGFAVFNNRNHPEIDWQVATTEHFEIMYPAHLAGIEEQAAAVAEETFAALQANLGPVDFPDPIRVYLSDEDEIANGIAYESSRVGVTTIWVHVNSIATIWTGEVKWLRKVMAHEIAHIFHYRKVRSNIGTAQNLLADALPSVWAEGVAQYLTEKWDAARGDAILRTAVFEDRLSYTDGTSPQNGRLRYAVGNSQVRYLAETRGDSIITKLLEHRQSELFGLAKVHDFYAAFRATVGIPYGTFYEEWRKHVNVYYNTLAGQMERVDSLNVRRLGVPGTTIRELQFSPDTTRIAAVVLSSLARPVTRLYTMHNPGDSTSTRRGIQILAEGSIVGPISWSPDGSRIAYTRTVRGRHGSFVNDLFLVTTEGDITRLTDNRRALSPSFAPSGEHLAFVGMNGPTANVFVLNLETGTERQLTDFTGDVQITSARWSPDDEYVAFSLFDADGNRQLALVDVVSGEVSRLNTDDQTPLDERDDRFPVWNATGDSLAFTSLRDRIGNVFVTPATVDAPASGPSTLGVAPGDLTMMGSGQSLASREERVTFLYAGARVVDWLPPDSLHPAGRLVLVASETKRRDRVFIVDARRRAEAVPLDVPATYATWTEHRPPADIPWRVDPDSSLIRERHEYNALANLDHAITLGLPYADPGEDGALFTSDDDWGAFATSIFLEPLGKHQVFLLGGISATRPIDRSFLYLSYTNRQLAPTVTADLYRFPGPASAYGNRILVEDLIGGDVSAVLPLDWTTRPYASWAVGARARLARASPYRLDSLGLDLASDGLPLVFPEAGTRADVQVGLAYRFQRPYRLNVIHPLDGSGVRGRVTIGAPLFGASANVEPDVEAFHTLRVPFGRLLVHGRATARFGGAQLPQDYVGLSRFDNVSAALPFIGPLSTDDAERVRGFRRYAVGTRALFGSAEYRLAPLFDLRTSVLGLVSFRDVAPTLFVDGGLVWGDGIDAIQRAGTGAELRNRVSLAGFSFLHAVGLAVPTGDLERVWDGSIVWDDVDLYYRLQAALPF